MRPTTTYQRAGSHDEDERDDSIVLNRITPCSLRVVAACLSAPLQAGAQPHPRAAQPGAQEAKDRWLEAAGGRPVSRH